MREFTVRASDALLISSNLLGVLLIIKLGMHYLSGDTSYKYGLHEICVASLICWALSYVFHYIGDKISSKQ